MSKEIDYKGVFEVFARNNQEEVQDLIRNLILNLKPEDADKLIPNGEDDQPLVQPPRQATEDNLDISARRGWSLYESGAIVAQTHYSYTLIELLALMNIDGSFDYALKALREGGFKSQPTPGKIHEAITRGLKCLWQIYFEEASAEVLNAPGPNLREALHTFVWYYPDDNDGIELLRAQGAHITLASLDLRELTMSKDPFAFMREFVRDEVNFQIEIHQGLTWLDERAYMRDETSVELLRSVGAKTKFTKQKLGDAVLTSNLLWTKLLLEDKDDDLDVSNTLIQNASSLCTRELIEMLSFVLTVPHLIIGKLEEREYNNIIKCLKLNETTTPAHLNFGPEAIQSFVDLINEVLRANQELQLELAALDQELQEDIAKIVRSYHYSYEEDLNKLMKETQEEEDRSDMSNGALYEMMLGEDHFPSSSDSDSE